MKSMHSFIKKIMRFYLVGGIALGGNMLITFLVTDIWKYTYNTSLLLVFLFNITAVFYLQKYFTFKNSRKEQTKNQIISFVILVVILMSSLKLLVPFFNEYIHNYSLSTLIVAGLITIVNFVVQNYLIFYHKT